ncbi:SPOR domain-containing protein [uncultured Massilia sp.]|uniref:SPOR domain-containing protein n=1 Tax=uncultured Massilia sp. TaxID=169973 RepID=UPI0025D18DE8|nr:SPOR domain-containing protein [uncultured Massilia sp.]
MLRFAFWSLLILNALLFAYGQGYLGAARGNEHEPARLKRQFNTAKMTLLTGEQAQAAARAAPAPSGPAQDAPAAPATPAPAPAPAAAAAPAFACTEIGPFDASDARRFETRLAALDLGERVARENVQAQDVTSWLVNIPPQGGKEGAERKSNELRQLGVTNFYVLQGDSPLKYAISLGVFKTEAGAQAMLAQLNKQGVRSARITPRGPQTTHYVFRLRALDAPTRKRVAGYAERYDVDVRDCS